MLYVTVGKENSDAIDFYYKDHADVLRSREQPLKWSKMVTIGQAIVVDSGYTMQ